MSIIHDALKKVQDKAGPQHRDEQKKTSAQPDEPVYGHPEIAGSKASIEKASPVLILLGVALSIAIVVIFLILFRLAKAASTGTPSSIPQTTSAPQAHKPISLSNAIQKAIAGPAAPAVLPSFRNPALSLMEPGVIHLEGIMDRDGKRVALINGEVYEEGEVAEDALIAEISLTSITVIKNGQKETLPLKKKPVSRPSGQ